jgi:hypothetical protein
MADFEADCRPLVGIEKYGALQARAGNIVLIALRNLPRENQVFI